MTTFTQESIAALRREIHSKPEPGWAEFVSSARAIEKLESLGFTVKCGREVINPDFIRGANRRQIEEGLAFAKSQGVKEEILERLDGVTGVVGLLETGRPGPAWRSASSSTACPSRKRRIPTTSRTAKASPPAVRATCTPAATTAIRPWVLRLPSGSPNTRTNSAAR